MEITKDVNAQFASSKNDSSTALSDKKTKAIQAFRSGFARRFKRAREERGSTQSDIAEALDIQHSKINRIENAKTTIDTYSFLQVCEYLSVSPSYLLGIPAKEDDALRDFPSEVVQLAIQINRLDKFGQEFVRDIIARETTRMAFGVRHNFDFDEK